MQRTVVRPVWAGMRLPAAVAVLMVASACGSAVRGETSGAAAADINALANDVTLDVLECAHDAGVQDAYMTGDGGIIDGVDGGTVVPDCFAKVLEMAEYAVFADDSPAMMRSTYEGLVVIQERLSREGCSSTTEKPPTFEEWMSSGRTWSPYNDVARIGDVDTLESASMTCERD